MKRFLAVLVVLAAVVAVAAFDVPKNAATVNGVGVPRATLNADMTAVAKSPGYQCLVNAQVRAQGAGPVTIYGVGSSAQDPDSFATSFAAGELQGLIRNELVQQLARRQGVSVSAADLAAARTDYQKSIASTLQSASCGVTAGQLLASLPGSFVDAEVRTQATFDALYAHAAGGSLSAAGLAQYYRAHPSAFATVCVRGLQTATAAQAQALRARLVAGASFDQVATAAGQPASVQCITPANPAFANASAALRSVPAGSVSAVLSDGQAFDVIQVVSRKPSTLAAARPVARQLILAAGSRRFGPALTRTATAARVTVDPRYGRWLPVPAFAVGPPPSPPISSILKPAANRPQAQPAAAVAPGQLNGPG